MIRAKSFITKYFKELFINKDIDCLNRYLDQNYYDYDIGPSVKDHIKNSKEFLMDLFRKDPFINVKVIKVKCLGNVICAHLRWITKENMKEVIKFEGVASFEIKNKKIIKRNTLFFDKKIL